MQVTTFGFEDPCPDRIVFPCQTHSSKVTEIVTGLEDLSECDGVWTRRDSKNLEIQNFALGIKTADCAPIAFWDEEKYGIIHCGWRGLVGGIVEEALEIFNPPRSPFRKGGEPDCATAIEQLPDEGGFLSVIPLS